MNNLVKGERVGGNDRKKLQNLSIDLLRCFGTIKGISVCLPDHIMVHKTSRDLLQQILTERRSIHRPPH